MRYIGLLLDNETLRNDLISLRTQCLGIVEALSSMSYDAQYNMQGQKRGRSTEELIAELEQTSMKIADKMDVDFDHLKKGVSDTGVADENMANKVSASFNEGRRNDIYLNASMHFSDAYRANGLERDLVAVFLNEDTETASIRLLAIPVAHLQGENTQETGATRQVTDSALQQFHMRYAQDLATLMTQPFTSAVSEALPGQAKRALDKYMPKEQAVTDALHGEKPKDRIFFAFYTGPKKAGCVISDEFNFLRGENTLGMDMKQQMFRSGYLALAVDNQALSTKEMNAFEVAMRERLPVDRKPHKRDVAASKPQMA